MRGFADNSVDNIYLDGLKAMGDSGTFSSMQVDPYFLERIDVLKGPSSVLYGRSLPGGLVALTSKKPLYEDYRQITGSIGNMGQKEMGFDFSGPLDEEKRIAYRLVGLGKGSDTQFDHVKEERYAIALTLAIDFSDDTTLTLQGYLQHDPNGGYHGGVPADGTLSHHNGRHISREFFDGEPSKDDFDRTQRMFGYQLEHRIDDVWSARQNFRYLDSDVDLSQVYAYGWSASEPNKLNRYFSGAREHLQAYIVDNMLQAEFATGAARHTLLTGLDYQRRRTVVDWRSGSASALDAFNPVYGDDAISYFPDDNHTRRLEQTGVYLQDLIDIDQWRFSLGLRQDWVSVTDKNRSTGSKADDDWEKFTGRIGALYLFDNGLAPYVSYPSRSTRTPIPTPPARPGAHRGQAVGTRPEVPGAGQQQLLHRLAVPYHPGKRRLQGTPGQLLHLGRRSALPGARTGGPYPAQRQPETARQLHLHRHHLHQVAGRQPGPYAEPGAQAHGFAVGRLCLRRRPAQRSEHRRRRALRRRDLGGQGKHLAGAGLHPGRRADRLRPRQARPGSAWTSASMPTTCWTRTTWRPATAWTSATSARSATSPRR